MKTLNKNLWQTLMIASIAAGIIAYFQHEESIDLLHILIFGNFAFLFFRIFYGDSHFMEDFENIFSNDDSEAEGSFFIKNKALLDEVFLSIQAIGFLLIAIHMYELKSFLLGVHFLLIFNVLWLGIQQHHLFSILKRPACGCDYKMGCNSWQEANWIFWCLSFWVVNNLFFLLSSAIIWGVDGISVSTKMHLILLLLYINSFIDIVFTKKMYRLSF